MQYYSSRTLTNTSLWTRFKVSERQRNQITNLIGEAVEAGHIKRKDAASGSDELAVSRLIDIAMSSLMQQLDQICP